jgi:hypothetical protein
VRKRPSASSAPAVRSLDKLRKSQTRALLNIVDAVQPANRGAESRKPQIRGVWTV